MTVRGKAAGLHFLPAADAARHELTVEHVAIAVEHVDGDQGDCGDDDQEVRRARGNFSEFRLPAGRRAGEILGISAGTAAATTIIPEITRQATGARPPAREFPAPERPRAGRKSGHPCVHFALVRF